MRKIPATLVLTALAAAVPAALAQQVTGSVSVGGIATEVDEKNPWKLFEYRDLDDGVLAGFRVNINGGSWYHGLFGENLGRDDQFLEARGGRYGVLKYRVYGDDVIHNWTFNAITPFNGVGSNNLGFTGTTPSTDISTWNGFDYTQKHKNIGGFAEFTPGVDSPLYFRVSANRKKTEGIRPLGQAGGSPGGPVYELPLPLDWTTNDVSGEVGYSTKRMHISASVLYSKFEDHNDLLAWANPYQATGPNGQLTTIASDNEMWRYAVNATFRQLPMGSTLALRGTFTKLENSLPVQSTYVPGATTGVTRLANPSSSQFEGEIENRSFSAALNTNWARGIDSKIYYNYYERENNTHHIVFTPGGPGTGGACDFAPGTGAALTTCTTEFLHFEKKNFGAEVGFRIGRQNRITAGIDRTEIERERVDFDKTDETKYTIEWKSSMVPGLDTRVKYQHLKRDSEFLLGDYGDLFMRYTYRFDTTPLDRDLFKVSLDFSPVDNLDLGAEFIHKRNDYKDVVFGRRHDSRREVILSAAYGINDGLRVSGFIDWERARYDSSHWVGAIATFPLPNSTGTAYPWDANVHDKSRLVGVAADWTVNPRLKLTASAIHQKNDGNVDFESINNRGNPQDISNFENIKKTTLHLKGTFAAMKNLDVTLGAAYEKYDVDDALMNDYTYALRTGTAPNFTQHYYTGAYGFSSYKANIFYAYLTYRF
ncbi:MAG TPA: MtrB/PioB family outer membrane beta-barrel protein [Usitatibacter sp.]|nr:MtrB/PioB family outer membrane beta-barrel protein [Usitatibacter sp.]